MTRITEMGIWEAVLESAEPLTGCRYKYRVSSEAGTFLKADPYARRTESPPETASVYTDLSAYTWQDDGWMSYRHRTMVPQKQSTHPINIYEIHLGSWKRHDDGRPYTYADAARELVPYVKHPVGA